MARLLRRDRDRLLDGRGRRSAATRRRCSSATTPRRDGTTSSRRSSCSACSRSTSSARGRRPRAVGDRRRAARGVRRVHRGDDHRRRLGLLAFSGYPPRVRHRRQRRADVLRLPRLQRDLVRGRRSARPRARAAEGDVRRAGRDRGPLRLDLARRVRDADRRRGCRVRRDGDRRGGPSGARRGGLRDGRDRGAAGDRVLGERDALRIRRTDEDAGASGSSRRSSAARPGRRAAGPAHHRRVSCS